MKTWSVVTQWQGRLFSGFVKDCLQIAKQIYAVVKFGGTIGRPPPAGGHFIYYVTRVALFMGCSLSGFVGQWRQIMSLLLRQSNEAFLSSLRLHLGDPVAIQ